MQDNEPINLTYGQMSDMVNRIEQIPSLSGEGAPTSSTPAFHIGQTYLDTTTDELYYCASIPGENDPLEYTWEPIAGDVPEYVAGDNVTITDESGALVISATDTTYSNFTGTDGTAAGTAGLVPAPATTDAGKYLGASGLWETIQAGGGITELTTADYNYPDNNPTQIAAYLLDDGIYNAADVPVYLASYQEYGLIIVESLTSTLKTVLAYNGAGPGAKMYYMTAVNSVNKQTSLLPPTVVQTTGTSTSSVMSQNAVTNMIAPRNSNDALWVNNPKGENTFPATLADYSITINPTTNGTASGGATAISAIAINGTASGHSAISIGANSSATQRGSVAIGRGASATSVGEMNIGTNDKTAGYNSTNYRLLSGVHYPVNDHDAATKGYVDPTTDASAPTTATVGRLGQIQIDTTTATAYMCVAVDDVTPSYTWKQITA